MIRQLSRTCLPLLLLAQASLLACVTPAATPRSSTEAEVREKSVFLCQHGLLFVPELSRFPLGARPADYLRQEDIFFLMDNPGWVSRRSMPPRPAPLSCEPKSVTMFPDSIIVRLQRTFQVGGASVQDEPTVVFVGTSRGWRVSYWFPEANPSPTAELLKDASEPLQFSSEEMTRPERLSGPDMSYTQEALQKRVQGLLIIRCVLARAGQVKDCRVLKPLPYLTEPSLDALRASRYKPVTFRGEPVDVEYTFNMVFRMPVRSPYP